MRIRSALLCLAAAAAAGAGPAPGLRTASFDRDPGWHGHNNRSTVPEPRVVRQEFGYSRTQRAGGGAGEIGGLVTPAAEPAYYARKIPVRTLDQPLSASGKLVVEEGAGNVLLGFFNAGTLNEWRTPNTVALRINGRGEGFHLHVEYATSRWRAGGDFLSLRERDSGRKVLRLLPSGQRVYSWALRYDPAGSGGGGSVTAALDGEQVVLPLEPGHRADGAAFNRFGLLTVMKSADTGGTLWIDEVTVNGIRETFDRDPGWDGRGNRRSYTTDNVRPRFDFGFSPTAYAGRARGEIGGRFYRGDGRYPHTMAYYGDRLQPLDLDGPLAAAGTVCFRRGVTDSTVLFGWFHSAHSLESGGTDAIGTPPDFLGARIDGPSREGHYFLPAYRLHGQERGDAPSGPYIYPDGKKRRWSLDYAPEPDGGGRITVTLDGATARLAIPAGHRRAGAHFDRFGFVTTHVDGNGQEVYLDDLRYTWRR